MTTNNNNGYSHNYHNLLKAILPTEELIRAGRQLDNLGAIESYALSLAKAIRTDPYDPTNNYDEKRREEQFQKDTSDLKDAEIAAAHAAIAVHDAEHQLAKIQTGLVEPKPDRKITVLATAALAISIAPTLRDVFFSSLDDKYLAWMTSFVGGGVIGALITWSLIGIKDPSGKRSTLNVVGLIGAIGIGIFTFLLRLAAGDLLIAVAMAVLEFSAVALLEAHASGLREPHRQFRAACDEHMKAAAEVQTHKGEANRRDQALQEIQGRLDAHRHYLAIRAFCAQKPAEIEQAALEIARKAYHERVAEEDRVRKGLPKELRS